MKNASKMMVGIAIGDAFGAGYEFRFNKISKYKNIVANDYIAHPKPGTRHRAGMYTDDTQMSMAVAEVLISGDEFSRENLADKFVEVYKRQPIDGYARGFQAFLESVSDGKEFIEKIKPHSKRNGAAMRSVPLGVIKDINRLVDYATINASVTHNTPKGIDSSVAVALMSHYRYHEGRNPDIVSEVLPFLKDSETVGYLKEVSEMKGFDAALVLGEKYKNVGVPCDGMKTAGAVNYILSNFDYPQKVLEESVRLGGDTDSVASIALGIRMADRLPQSIDFKGNTLIYDLYAGEYGKKYLYDLGKQLDALSDNSVL